MQTLDDVHLQLAAFFQNKVLEPYVYLLSRKLAEGHICLQLTDVDRDQATDPQLAGYSFADTRELLEQQPLVATGRDQRRPFVLHGNRLYFHRYFQYESNILSRIAAFLETEKAELAPRMQLLLAQQELVSRLFHTNNSAPALPDWQLAAAISGVLHNFTIITGGPGTGKTTTVARILALLYATQPGLRVALAAPTGKAAARMAESLKNAKLPLAANISEQFQSLQPATLHRLLQSKAQSPYFKYNRNNPLPFDVVIVDESSMIDVALFAKLLDAIGPRTRLILLGDKDQLASVEAGSLFGDLCQAQSTDASNLVNCFDAQRLQFINRFAAVGRQLPQSCCATSAHPLFQHVVELQYSHRFSGDAGIGKLSRAVIQGDLALLGQIATQNSDAEVLFDPAYDANLFADFIAGYQAFIRETDTRTALKLLNTQRVLCALREGGQGVLETNRRIEQMLQLKRLINRRGELFYEHRPVMLTRNYYNLGLFNGDTGIVRRDPRDGMLRVFFEKPDGDLVGVAPGLIPECETAYAMTIHKSQGSEFGQVLVLLPQGNALPILTRELVYTGITRARTKVVVQGPVESLLYAAARSVERGSGMIERLSAGSDLFVLQDVAD